MQLIKPFIDEFTNDVSIDTYKKLYYVIPKILIENVSSAPIYYYNISDATINSINTKRIIEYINEEISDINEKLIICDDDIYAIYDDNPHEMGERMYKYYTQYTTFHSNMNIQSIIDNEFSPQIISQQICHELNSIHNNKYLIYNKLFSTIKACIESHLCISTIPQLLKFTFPPGLIINAIIKYIDTTHKSIQNEIYKHYTNNEMKKCIMDVVTRLYNDTLKKLYITDIINTIEANCINTVILHCGRTITQKRNEYIQRRIKYIRLQHIISAYSSVDYINDMINTVKCVSSKQLITYSDILINLYKYIYKILTTDGPTVIKFDSTLESIDHIVESAVRVNLHDLDFTFISGITYKLVNTDIVCVYKNAYELYETNMNIIDNIRNDWKTAFGFNINKFL